MLPREWERRLLIIGLLHCPGAVAEESGDFVTQIVRFGQSPRRLRHGDRDCSRERAALFRHGRWAPTGPQTRPRRQPPVSTPAPTGERQGCLLLGRRPARRASCPAAPIASHRRTRGSPLPWPTGGWLTLDADTSAAVAAWDKPQLRLRRQRCDRSCSRSRSRQAWRSCCCWS